ncbi:hypothetical protein AB6F62_00605 [Providencia huaxiensis]|uniref:hypothetical protein n=1 Tax=Providencia huaxiensis TaxID=2027290 RepID=UPI0034DD92D6
MATPSISLLVGFSSIYNVVLLNTIQSPKHTKHCSEVLPDFGVKFGQFDVRYINFFDYHASATGYADTCLQIIVNGKDVGTTCSVNVPEIPVLLQCIYAIDDISWQCQLK